MYWQLSFYGSIFGAYIMYHYVKKNLPTILFIMGKSEAYYIIMKRYCTSLFCSSIKNKISKHLNGIPEPNMRRITEAQQ